MRNASETRKITESVLKAREEERERKIQAFVEEKIAPLIEGMAERGYSSAEVSVSGWDRNRVEEILMDYDYKVTTSDSYGCIIVSW